MASAAVTRVSEKERAPASPTGTDFEGKEAAGEGEDHHRGRGEVAVVPYSAVLMSVRSATAVAAEEEGRILRERRVEQTIGALLIFVVGSLYLPRSI